MEGVSYSITCSSCLAAMKKALYWGESGRSGFQRGCEHLSDVKNKNHKSPLVKHMWEVHREDEEEPKFEMEVLKKHKTALRRQIAEAVLIQSEGIHYKMNSKSE